MEATIKNISTSTKIIIAIITLFTGIVGSWAIIEEWQTKNIDGGWYLTFKVNESAYKPYIGETHTQKVFFTQNKNAISGSGEKWEYNGQLLPFDAHRKVEYTGTIDGSELKATFRLYGKLRESSGIICLKVSDDGKHVEGTFIGTAGDTKGIVFGERKN